MNNFYIDGLFLAPEKYSSHKWLTFIFNTLLYFEKYFTLEFSRLDQLMEKMEKQEDIIPRKGLDGRIEKNQVSK